MPHEDVQMCGMIDARCGTDRPQDRWLVYRQRETPEGRSWSRCDKRGLVARSIGLLSCPGEAKLF